MFGRRSGAMQGADVAATAEIDLAQVASGASVMVSFEAVDLCERCHGNAAEPGTPIVTCERCDGAGQLHSVSRTPFGQMVRAVACEACNGDGRVAQEPCRACRGRGRTAGRRTLEVDVPAGIEDGQRIRLTGRGHAGEAGGPAGDLYVQVRVREDERFVRDGVDLITAVDVPAPAAALGTNLEVPTLDGPAEVELVPGTQPGDTVTLAGRGLPPLHGGRAGNLRVVVNVVIPRRLTAEQRELLERLRDSLTDDNLHAEEGVFGRLRRVLRT